MSAKFLSALVRAKGLGRLLPRPKSPFKKYRNNTWLTISESDAVLVFVHGLYSDAASCWTCVATNKPVYWPELAREDPRLDSASIFLAGYHATGREGYGLNDCANELMRALRIPHSERRTSVMDKQRIVLICHSAGGAVVRYMLEAYANDFATKEVGLLLLASPSYGSTYASLRALLTRGTDNLVAQFAWGNEILADLDRRFRALIQNGRIPGLVGREAYENIPPLPFGLAKIVGEHSATRYFADPAHLADTDHYSIAKPDRREHQTHELLIDFYTTHFARRSAQRSPPRVQPTVTSTSTTLQSSVRLSLFDLYTAACEPFYILRPVDALVAESLSIGHIWLWGPSGCGKTSIVRRHAIFHGRPYVYITLGLTETDSVVAALRDVWLSLLQKLQLSPPPILNLPTTTLVVSIGDLIAKYLPNHLIYIDEIPLTKELDLKSLWGNLEVAAAVAQEQAGCDPRYLISSLAAPNLRVPLKGAPERLTLLENPIWIQSEVAELLRRIETTLGAAISIADREKLAMACKGSPRFVKKVLRQYHVRPQQMENHIEAIRQDLA